MFAMVVVPVFMRETTMILERDLQRISPLDLGAALKQKQRIRMAGLVAIAVTLFAFIVPAVMNVQVFFGVIDSYSTISFVAFLYSVSIDPYWASMAFIPVWGLSVSAFFLVFNLVFARRLLRYYIGLEEKQRTLRVGILSMAWPTLIAVIMNGLVYLPYGVFPVTLPIPALFIAGLFVMRYKDPVSRIVEFTEHSLVEVQELPPQKKFEDDVTVPFVYIMTSFIKKKLARVHSALRE